MDYAKFIKEMLPLVGGTSNIKNAITCHTRLRLTLADYSLVNDGEVKKLEGVMATKDSADQYQIILGENVKAAYNELLKHVNFSTTVDTPKTEGAGKRKFNPIGSFAETMSGVFTPLIIAICGSGLMTGIQVLLSTIGVIHSGDAIHEILGVLGNVAFYFLPFMVAVTVV